MNLETTIEVTNGLKTLNNLNYTAFRELLFPDAMDYYVEDKWSLFREDMSGLFGVVLMTGLN